MLEGNRFDQFQQKQSGDLWYARQYLPEQPPEGLPTTATGNWVAYPYVATRIYRDLGYWIFSDSVFRLWYCPLDPERKLLQDVCDALNDGTVAPVQVGEENMRQLIQLEDAYYVKNRPETAEEAQGRATPNAKGT